MKLVYLNLVYLIATTSSQTALCSQIDLPMKSNKSVLAFRAFLPTSLCDRSRPIQVP